MDILVGVGGLPVNVKGKRAIRLALDGDVQQGDFSVGLLLLGPLDVGVHGVDVGEEGLCVVFVYGDERIIRFAQPKQDGLGI